MSPKPVSRTELVPGTLILLVLRVLELAGCDHVNRAIQAVLKLA
jgi:hypothetical protein